ncbi:MAG: ribulose-phosphate 3-epimerase [Candidatus Eremiobacterota bacterium]
MGEEVKAADQGGADWIHLDVMDGAFVPPITFGSVLVKSIRSWSRKPFDVHLMVDDPGRFVSEYARAGTNQLTVHAEACTHLQRVLACIREEGMRAGVALNPATGPQALRYVLDDLDFVLLMTVNPGYSGQKFLSQVVEKIRIVRDMVGERAIDVGVDGGVTPATAPLCRQAGANVLVAATAIFGQPDYARAIADLRDGTPVGAV